MVSSSSRRAVSTRAEATKRAGVLPTSRVNTRAKLRGLMAARRASAVTDRSSLGVFEDVRLQFAQRFVLGELHRELRAELRLSAGPLQEHDQLARHRQRDVAAVVLLDQRQCQVHSRGHAGRGVDRAVTHEDGVGLDVRVGKLARQFLGRAPVRGGAAALEQPGLGQQERAGADRGDAAHAAGLPAQPRQHAADSIGSRCIPMPPAISSVSIPPPASAIPRPAYSRRPEETSNGPRLGPMIST